MPPTFFTFPDISKSDRIAAAAPKSKPLSWAILSMCLGSWLRIFQTPSSCALAGARGVFLRGREACFMFNSSRMSSALVTILAPNLSRLLGPEERGEKILPGTQKTSRFCSKASLAVISEPESSLASIIKVPRDNPEIILFQIGRAHV